MVLLWANNDVQASQQAGQSVPEELVLHKWSTTSHSCGAVCKQYVQGFFSLFLASASSSQSVYELFVCKTCKSRFEACHSTLSTVVLGMLNVGIKI